ncbi:hypothetical protein MNBD_GAMMA21-2965 [hydrothermal vent metagenome]|uniref:NERD domain-containing protein n=1 Tax=hydrothermal vent metagenome TaxID=652676 RepID=A0A3B1APD3_9ZZZZ
MELINEFLNSQHPVVPGVVLAILVGLLLFFSWAPVQQLLSHWSLSRLLKQIGLQKLKNVYIPDGLGDVIYVERLILQADGLLLVTIKPFRGNIFAAEQIDQWTQVVGHHSYKFPNPLHQQETDLQALQAVMPDTPINRLVVFAKGSHFPKGKPADVCDFSDLKVIAEQQQNKIVIPAIQSQWQELIIQAEPAVNMKQSILFRRGDKQRLLLGVLSGLAAIAFSIWYLGGIL